MDKFTVIIPIYNVEKYVEECINSVLCQTHKNIEVLLINDGSEDSSLQICNNYKKKDSRVRVICKENGGLSSARNAGLDNATGKYVLFLDGDDYIYDRNAIETFVNIFNSTQCDLIYGTYSAFLEKKEENTRKTIVGKMLHIDNEEIKDMNPEEVMLKLFQHKSYISSAATKIYRRDILENSKMRFMLNVYHEDEEWTPRVIMHCKNIYIYNQKFYMRRYRENSIMTTKDEEKILSKMEDILFIANKMIKYTNFSVKKSELEHVLNEYFGTFVITALILYNDLENNSSKKVAIKKIEDNIHLFKYVKKIRYKSIKYVYMMTNVNYAARFAFYLKNLKNSIKANDKIQEE